MKLFRSKHLPPREQPWFNDPDAEKPMAHINDVYDVVCDHPTAGFSVTEIVYELYGELNQKDVETVYNRTRNQLYILRNNGYLRNVKTRCKPCYINYWFAGEKQ